MEEIVQAQHQIKNLNLDNRRGTFLNLRAEILVEASYGVGCVRQDASCSCAFLHRILPGNGT